MDEDGYFNFGPTSFWQRAVIERTDRYGISGNLGDRRDVSEVAS
jgi:hypothetical protein